MDRLDRSKSIPKDHARVQDNKTLLDMMSKAMGTAQLPDLKAIVCSFFNQLGGHDAFAQLLIEQFRAAKPGSMIKARITEMILQAAKVITSKEAARDVNLLTDEDLQKELRLLLGSVVDAGKYAGTTANEVGGGRQEMP